MLACSETPEPVDKPNFDREIEVAAELARAAGAVLLSALLQPVSRRTKS